MIYNSVFFKEREREKKSKENVVSFLPNTPQDNGSTKVQNTNLITRALKIRYQNN